MVRRVVLPLLIRHFVFLLAEIESFELHPLVENQGVLYFDRELVDLLLLRLSQVRTREDGVQHQSEGGVDELRNDSGEQRRVGFEAGVGVDLDEVELEVLVEHEVVAEDLEAVADALGVDLVVGGPDGVGDDLFDLEHGAGRSRFWPRGR